MATKIKLPDTPLRRLIAQHAGPEPVTVQVTMTVEMAADALSKNSINRPVRESHRSFLAKQMSAGRWHPTHQGIAFSSEGELLDGQHRLLALTDAAMALPMTVTFNLPRAAFAVVDYGSLPRTLADMTGFDRRVIEPVTFLYRMGMATAAREKFSLEDFAPYWAAFGQESKALIEFCSTARRALSSAPIKAATVYIAKVTDDDTVPFISYRALIAQDYEGMPPSLQAFNRQLLRDDIRSPAERFVRMAAALEKQDVSRIQVRDVFAKAAEYRVRIAAIASAHAKQVWRIKEPPR